MSPQYFDDRGEDAARLHLGAEREHGGEDRDPPGALERPGHAHTLRDVAARHWVMPRWVM